MCVLEFSDGEAHIVREMLAAEIARYRYEAATSRYREQRILLNGYASTAQKACDAIRHAILNQGGRIGERECEEVG